MKKNTRLNGAETTDEEEARKHFLLLHHRRTQPFCHHHGPAKAFVGVDQHLVAGGHRLGGGDPLLVGAIGVGKNLYIKLFGGSNIYSVLFTLDIDT